MNEDCFTSWSDDPNGNVIVEAGNLKAKEGTEDYSYKVCIECDTDGQLFWHNPEIYRKMADKKNTGYCTTCTGWDSTTRTHGKATVAECL